MGRKKEICLIVLLFVFLMISCGNKQGNAMDEATLQNSVESKPSIDVFGMIEAKNDYSVSLSFPAQIQKIFVQNGESVLKGEAILRFDNSQYLAEIKYKEYELAVAQLTYSSLKKELEKSGKTIDNRYLNLQNNINTAKKELEQLEDELSQNRTFLKNKNSPELLTLFNNQKTAKSELLELNTLSEEKKSLLENQVISQQEYDESILTLNKQKAALKTIDLSIDSAVFQLESLIKQQEIKSRNLSSSLENLEREILIIQSPETSELEIQRLKIGILENQLRELKNKLTESFISGNKLIAQFDKSIILGHQTQEGITVGAHTFLYSEIDKDSLVVIANIPEDFIPDISIGKEAEIIPLADRSRKFKGHITKISEMAEVIKGESVVQIEIAFVNQDQFLKLGYNVDVKIYTEPQEAEGKKDQDKNTKISKDSEAY